MKSAFNKHPTHKARTPNFDFGVSDKPGVTPLLPKASLAMPRVFYTFEVAKAIRYIIDTVSSEVGWFGYVEQRGTDYLVTDVYIPEQTVSGTSVDMDPDAITNLTMQLLDEGKNPEQLRYHGHSHVNMAVFPSGVDQDMVDDFLEHADWFIRGIYNKKHESRVDVFDRTKGLVFQHVTHGREEPELPDTFYADLKDMIEDNVSTYRPKIYTPPTRQTPAIYNKPRTLETAADDPWLQREYRKLRGQKDFVGDKEEDLYLQAIEDDAEYLDALSDPFYFKEY